LTIESIGRGSPSLGSSVVPRNAEIDRLRAVAVLMVLLTHIGDYLAVAGIAETALMLRMKSMALGVDLFFVISGFVVSRVILTEIDRLPGGSMQGWGSFLAAFYTRRAHRILPMAWLVLVVFSAALLPVWGDGAAWRYALATAGAAVTLWVNYFLYWFPPGHYSTSPFGPYWSLAIEEQFYLVYPLFLLAVRSTRARLLWLAGALLLIAAVLRPLYLDAAIAAGHSRAAFATHFRADGILAGCLLGVLAHEGTLARPGSTGRTLRLVAWTAVLALLALMVEARARYPAVLSLPVVVTLSGALVVLASRQTGWILPGTGPLGRTLDWTGLRSYGIYLINWPLLWLLDGLWPGARTLDSAGLATFLAGWLGLTAMLTELCFRWMERPLIARGARCAARFGSPGAITTGERH
jgi:peptidoglycan/LPS O-acetylase OafA/YrhL